MDKRMRIVAQSGVLLGAAALLAACAGGAPPAPVGLAAEDLAPQRVSPEGLLGGVEVGADSLADPAIATLGDPAL